MKNHEFRDWRNSHSEIMKKLILLFIFIAFNSNAASMKMIGSKGDPNEVTRVIEVKMHDNYYEPSSIQVKKGETVKIIV